MKFCSFVFPVYFLSIVQIEFYYLSLISFQMVCRVYHHLGTFIHQILCCSNHKYYLYYV